MFLVLMGKKLLIIYFKRNIIINIIYKNHQLGRQPHSLHCTYESEIFYYSQNIIHHKVEGEITL